MTGCLLDTNVLSELTKRVPHPNVLAFLSHESRVWLPAVAIYEVEYGLRLLPVGRRRHLLAETYETLLEQYLHRILPLDRRGAECAAGLRASARQAGRSLDVGDALIAGTAKANDLAVATRNVGDFEGLDVPVINPWNTA